MLIIGNIYCSYVCDNSNPNMIVKLQEFIDCTSAKYKSANIDVKTLNDKNYRTDAVLMTYINFKCTTFSAIYCAFTVTRCVDDKTYIFDTLSQYDILNANKTLNLYGNNITYDENSNSYVYGEAKHYCVYRTFEQSVHDNIYIYMKRSKVNYRKGVMLSDLATMGECEYKHGYCKISDSTYMIWNIDKHATDIYEPNTVSAQADIIMSYHYYHFMFNYRGNPISLSVTAEIFNRLHNTNEFMETNEHEFLIKINNDNNRKKRDLSLARFEYFTNIQEIDKKRIMELCDTMAQGLLYIYALCKSDAYACVSKMLNITAIKVSTFGDMYSVTRCKDVKITKYHPSYNPVLDVCDVLIPITYIYNDNEHKGYYKIETGRIYNVPIKKSGICERTRYIDCPQDTDKYCIYDTLTGNITKTNSNFQILSSDTKLLEYDPIYLDVNHDEGIMLSEGCDKHYVDTYIHEYEKYDKTSNKFYITTIILYCIIGCVIIILIMMIAYVCVLRKHRTR
jgi:hypothetical protein